jgi:putative transposase
MIASSVDVSIMDRAASVTLPFSYFATCDTFRDCVFDLHYHLVIVTKYRRRCITKPMLDRLREITAQRCNDWNGSLTEFKGEADHVHALISMPPNIDLSRFVNNDDTT